MLNTFCKRVVERKIEIVTVNECKLHLKVIDRFGMDSEFNDIAFLMEHIKHENTDDANNDRPTGAASLAEGVQNNTDPTYMTDLIMDYINRTLKVGLWHLNFDKQKFSS